MKISVLTPGRDRVDHLAGLVDGLNRADAREFELLVGWMGGADPGSALDRARGFDATSIAVDGDELPLARARNELAAAARGDILVFLDVDCVPSRSLLTTYAATLAEHDAVTIGEVQYLPRGFRGDGAPETALSRAALPRPERRDLFPDHGEVRVDDRHELFWSLSFAVPRATFFDRIGGFDDAYRGYGIEDTDFAMRAARAEVPLAWVGGALAFHQDHPPTRLRPEGVEALVANARRYRERWGEWPAKGWLAELAARGMVDWDAEADRLEPRASAIR